MASADLRILTGAPGSGKTSILARVGPDVRIVPEPARRVLASQRASGGSATPDVDPASFVDLLVRQAIEDHRAARSWEGSVLFDRGAPDCVAYAVLLGVDPRVAARAVETCRYAREALVLEPWEEIYTPDDERRMTYEETVPFHRLLIETYERSGYELVVVPRGSIDERAAFVRERMALPPR